MKAIIIGSVTALLLLNACQEKPSADTEKTASDNLVTAPKAVEPPPAKQCYTYFSTKDTITVILNGPDSALTGSMVYAISGKDKNLGTLKGKMSGDTLFADYTFQSEGVTSVRELAFIKKEGKLLEGYGPVDEKGNRAFFTDKSKIQFTGNIPLTAENCR